MSALLSALILATAFSRPLERVSTMDPAFAQSIYDSRAIHLVAEPPLAIDYESRPYRIVPGLCELPEVTDGGRCYRLRISPDRAAQGVSAADVVRALERLRDPQLVSPNAWIVKDVSTIRALDARTVEIRLTRRVRYFSWLLTMTACAVTRADGTGTGPYVLSEWRKNHAMVFTRKPNVPTGGATRFDTIRYLVIDDVSTQWLMFLKGEIDYLGEVSRDNWNSVLGADGRLAPELVSRGVRLFSAPTLEVLYVGINMRDKVLGTNRALRQALNCAFDFPAWKRFSCNRIERCDGPVPPGVPERLETPFPYAFDLARARRLMVEAGYPDGIDATTGRRLVLTLTIGRATQESREAGELMAAFYEKIGVKLELAFMTWDAFLKAVNEGRVQMYRMGWVGDYPDAQNFLQLFYGPNRSPGVNHSNYASADFDAAYEKEDYRRCQEIVREDCPWIFTHVNMSQTLVGPRVGNFIPSDFPAGTEQFYEVR